MPQQLLLAEDAFGLLGLAVRSALRPAVERLIATLGQAAAGDGRSRGPFQLADVFRTLQGFEIWAQHGAWVKETRPTLGPGVRQRVEWASTIAEADAAAARAKREEIARRMQALLEGDAVLALPTVPDIAPLLNSDPKATEDFRTARFDAALHRGARTFAADQSAVRARSTAARSASR